MANCTGVNCTNVTNATNVTTTTDAPFDPFAVNPDNIGDNINKLMDWSLDFAGGASVALLLSVAAMVMGLTLLTFGSRLFKITLFLVSFVMGSGLGFYLVNIMFVDQYTEDTRATYCLVGGAVFGLIFGAIAVKLWKFALFVLGASVGFACWLTFKALAPGVLEEEWQLYTVLVVACLITGAAAMKLEKFWLIVGTPIIGSFVFVQGIDFFIQDDLSVFQILNYVSETEGGCAIDECYILYSMVIGLSVLGMLIQWRFTSEYAKERALERELEQDAKEEEMEMIERRKMRKKQRLSRSKKRRRNKRRRSDSDSDSD